MEFPEERYYGLNRILLSTVGLWPYDNFKVRYFRFILTLLINISFLSTQWTKLCVSEHNSDLFLKILSYNIVFILFFIKYITFYAILKNIKEFRERIRNNWDTLIDKHEIEIICKHGNIGKLLTLVLTISVYIIIILFYILSQYVSILLDIVSPLNESRPRKFVFPVEYFIDHDKYFYIITLHIAIGLLIATTNALATESFSLTNALHAFSLFKIASYRMKYILSEINSQMCITEKYAISHKRIVAAVDFHRRAIEFSELLKTSFGPAYLILFVIGVCSVSINLFNLFQIIMIERDILEIIKSSLFIAIHILALTLANYAGQEFINCDMHFYRTVCNTEWYNTPLKTQKLMLFLIQKTTKCYKVDAGGMFSPCLEGLATSLSMALSYFMVLCSI
ncbi:uncharacterized protein LOC112552607 [Pogonomyrmex barbatus]|uniref:Odorant receptor n=1 Tax=Pogonomyrmex barbatus TaxID=144034 RepID=A0A8N1S5I8_9HYME|nr:uncharacterized protein LOC112552607 [Pogonomyrmex barbatus]